MEAFSEKQNFLKSWWPLWLVTASVIVIIPFVVKQQTDAGLIQTFLPTIAVLLMLFLFVFLNLQTRVDELGIIFSFGLFSGKKRVIKWDEVKEVKVRQYNPIGDYGGWGNKATWNKNKRVYNVSGNMGLELILLNGKSVMLGTKQSEKITAYLNYLKSKYKLKALDTF